MDRFREGLERGPETYLFFTRHASTHTHTHSHKYTHSHIRTHTRTCRTHGRYSLLKTGCDRGQPLAPWHVCFDLHSFHHPLFYLPFPPTTIPSFISLSSNPSFHPGLSRVETARWKEICLPSQKSPTCPIILQQQTAWSL